MGVDFFWQPEATAPEVDRMLRTVAEFDARLGAGSGRTELCFAAAPKGELNVARRAGRIEIAAGGVSAAARGLGLALAGIEAAQKSPFSLLGVMIDCSRNKVFTVAYLKRCLVRLALAGCNTAMLYTEETYELPDEPFFGYLRGGYTLEELRELDNFAAGLGIELIGCIQTLGHMDELLQWECAYAGVTDTTHVLLADEPATYRLIGKMLAFWSSALRSRRIHVGMDEAHDLGRGRFMDRHGYERHFDIFNRHLARVCELCRQYGYVMPTIWSDMYFSMGDPDGGYYGNLPIPADVQAAIPQQAQLCYWDYYHTDREFYRNYIERHRVLSKNPLMVASGLWTFPKFWYDHNITRRTAAPCVAACRETGVTELIFAMWGDDGGYCLYDSVLAGIVYTMESAWGGTENEEHCAKLYHALTGQDYRRCLAISRMESEGEIEPDSYFYTPSAQLWDDPLLAVAFRGFRKRNPDWYEHIMRVYRELREQCPVQAEDGVEWRAVLKLVELLESKMRFRMTLEEAYQARNRETLRRLADETVPRLIALLDEFDALHREAWLACAKPFGLEMIQVRNAGVRSRLGEAARRIHEWLAGGIASIPELEASVNPAAIGYCSNVYRRYSSGSSIK